MEMEGEATIEEIKVVGRDFGRRYREREEAAKGREGKGGGALYVGPRW